MLPCVECRKKRGARRLHWDASYKEAKHLARYHGNSHFKALITGTNEVCCTVRKELSDFVASRRNLHNTVVVRYEICFAKSVKYVI